MWDKGADFVVEDLSQVQARWEGEKLILTIQSEDRPPTLSNGQAAAH